MNKPDYSYKSHILINYSKLLTAQRKANMFSFSLSRFKCDGVVNYTMKKYFQNPSNFETYQELHDYCKQTNLTKEWLECERINHANFQRSKRLHKRIEKMLHDYNCTFVTLTFTNKVLSSTKEDIRRKYVAQYCKSFGVPYVANIDFGDDTNREHYHALIGCEINQKTWSYGFSSLELVIVDSSSSIKLAKYIAKLTNHAIKATTHRQALIYSRDNTKLIEIKNVPSYTAKELREHIQKYCK